MNKLMIRPMTKADIPALCQADGGETPENRECFEWYLAWQEQAKDCVFLLAFLDGLLAGHLFVFYHDDPSLGQGMDMPQLADLYVFEMFRGKGIASTLLTEGERYAGTVSDRVFLTVRPHLTIRQAYERRGYRYFGEYGDDICLIKQLK